MRPLFAYGTFCKTAWREAIFGAKYHSEPATLAGWRRIAAGSGYFSLRPTVVALPPVPGTLVDLDEVGWRIADAWEAVPAYVRVAVDVNTMRGPVSAATYVCADERDAQPVEGDRFALVPDAEVEAAIAAFEATMREIRGARG